MPMLPSGRHVAITLAPLDDLLAGQDDPTRIHLIMGITTREHLCRYVDIQYLVPSQEKERDPPRWEESSLARPEGHVLQPTGHTLADWEKLAADWDPLDVIAFKAFLETRAADYLDDALEFVRSVQKALRTSPDFLTSVLARWHDLGVHPAQEYPKAFEPKSRS